MGGLLRAALSSRFTATGSRPSLIIVALVQAALRASASETDWSDSRPKFFLWPWMVRAESNVWTRISQPGVQAIAARVCCGLLHSLDECCRKGVALVFLSGHGALHYYGCVPIHKPYYGCVPIHTPFVRGWDRISRELVGHKNSRFPT